ALVEKHLFREWRAFAQRKEFQHLVLFAGKMNPGAAYFHGLGIEVDDQIASLDDGLGMALGTAHDGMNPGDQLVLVERLGHIIVGAKTEPADLVFDAGKT